MPNLIGEGFYDYVLDQINQREYNLAKPVRDEQDLLFQQAKTGWVRMSSGVDVKDVARYKSTALGDLKLKDAELARQYVLFGGVSKLKAGILRSEAEKAPINNDYAYGAGGLEMGLKPMPGIQSVNVTTGPRGSLRFAEVKIKAWNRAQFEIIDTLYLRLGFTMLLEWGHTSYIDNKGKYSTTIGDLSQDFLEGKALKDDGVDEGVAKGQELGQYDVLAMLRALRKKYQGNYDGLYGKVSNYSWSFAKDGSYDITVKLVSMGDIIESLKINSKSDSVSLQSIPYELDRFSKLSPADQAQEAYLYYLKPNPDMQVKDKGTLVEPYKQILAKQDADRKEKEKQIEEGTASSQTIIQASRDKHDIGHMLAQVVDSLDSVPAPYGRGVYRKFFGVSGKCDAIKQEWEGHTPTYYLRLGSFLEWYQKAKMVVGKNGKPLVKIDFDTDTNFMFYSYLQMSADPRICMVQTNYSVVDTTTNKVTKTLEVFRGGEPWRLSDQGPAKVMNVYMNLEFLLGLVDTSVDDKGKVSVLDYLQGICDGINRALGGINSLKVVVDEEEHTIRIIDEVHIPQRDQLLKEQNRPLSEGIFSLYGFRNVGGKDRASFITDFSIQTELSKDTAAMITIGAQAAGVVVGEDATAFSKWNEGLIDRIEPTKLDPNVKDATNVSEVFKDSAKNYMTFLNDLGTVNGEFPVWNTENIDTYPSFLSSYLQYKEAATAVKRKSASPTVGFLPINLSLTMDGLAGMKVYQRFSIDSTFLPSNYPNSLQFIISSISHTISDNKWSTNIQSIVVPTTVVQTQVTRVEGRDSKAQARGKVGISSSDTTTRCPATPPYPAPSALRISRIPANFLEALKQTPAYSGGRITPLGVLCVAHALTEGLQIPKSIAYRNNNPGNLRKGGGYQKFQTPLLGWQGLQTQVVKPWVQGTSKKLTYTGATQYVQCFKDEDNDYFKQHNIPFEERARYGYLQGSPSLRQYIHQYAPASDNNSPAQYIANVYLTLKNNGLVINSVDQPMDQYIKF